MSILKMCCKLCDCQFKGFLIPSFQHFGDILCKQFSPVLVHNIEVREIILDCVPHTEQSKQTIGHIPIIKNHMRCFVGKIRIFSLIKFYRRLAAVDIRNRSKLRQVLCQLSPQVIFSDPTGICLLNPFLLWRQSN